MMYYYIITTLISLAIVLTSYFFPSTFAFLGPETGEWFANAGMNLLRVVLFVKPTFIILMKYTELKTITLKGLGDYLKTIKGRSLKGLRHMLLSIVYFVAALGMKWRRLLGITTFLILFTHGGINVGHWLNNSFTLSAQLNIFWIFAGYLSLLALLIGFMTSNNFSIRLFKHHRKSIQNLAYAALLFGILHVAFLNFREYRTYIILLVIYIFFKFVEKKRINIF
ncbi:MAG: hypothetical protein WC010_01915 [Candidatus Absconditabacterales bacterium]